MTLNTPKKYYSHFLREHGGKLHFAAHSHHFWPDVTREAHLNYWDDCAKMSDDKWGKIFGEVIPRAQKHVAGILNLKDPQQIVFAPNTHELSTRLLSLFLGKKNLKILTTSSEFHSWRRQLNRLEELEGVEVSEISTKDILENPEIFLIDFLSLIDESYDLVFLSQVFFDSGQSLSSQMIKKLVNATPEKTLFVLDGYHAFAALPTDLSDLEGRIFYLAGGYKYAQAGEGAGFMVIPKGEWRPANTGWFADFGDLSKPAGTKVGYTSDAMAFAGATQEATGLYRFNAVWDLFAKEGITVGDIHQYVVNLQKNFIKNLPSSFIAQFELSPLFHTELTCHGHFLTFAVPNEIKAQAAQTYLKSKDILIDRRGSRLRFGFGLYQDQQDVAELCRRLF
jgi:selenocysteine lyase/cysteine desulfurase